MLHELPLVIFTICAQMSAGSFVVLGLIHLFGARVEPDVMDRVSDPALYALGPLLVLGLVASTFHLGSPLRAINSLRHVGTSWLSNEIVTGMAFLVLGGAFAICQWRKWLTARARQVLAMLAAAAGLFLVYCISRVYSLRTVPAWDTAHTAMRFFATAFLLGGFAVAAALVLASRYRQRQRAGTADEVVTAEDRLIERTLRWIGIGALAVLGAKYIGYPLYLAALGTSPDPAAQTSLRLLSDTYGGFGVAQLVLIFAGVATLAVFLVRAARRPASVRLLATVAVTAFVLVLAGEVIGRMLFYASMVRTGL